MMAGVLPLHPRDVGACFTPETFSGTSPETFRGLIQNLIEPRLGLTTAV